MTSGQERGTAAEIQIDADEALERFRTFLTSGLLTPRTLREGDWEAPKLVFVRVHRASATVQSNWTAESGTKSGKKISWTPLSGQHQETYEDVDFITADAWRRQEPGLLRSLAHARLGAYPTVDGALATDSTSATDVQRIAEERLQAREKEACAQMVPGRLKRNIQVNATITNLRLTEILLPVWKFEVIDPSGIHRGWVDGVTGRVHGNRPTSYSRVAMLGGIAAGVAALVLVGLLAVSALSGRAMVAAAEAERVAQEQREAEALRALREEWASSTSELTAAVQAAEDALAAREPETARSAVASSGDKLERLHEAVEDPELQALWSRYQSLEADLAHLETVLGGVRAAQQVVDDAEKCTTPLEIQTAWEDLKQVRESDPERQEAARLTRKLERCRMKSERELTAGLKNLMMEQRVAMQSTLERSYLDEGLDVRVSVQGGRKDRLKMTWILFGKAMVHQITDGGSMSPGSFLRNLQEAGFSRVTFSDGYDQSIWYDLEPESEDNGGQKVLAGMGLGEPLTLAEP